MATWKIIKYRTSGDVRLRSVVDFSNGFHTWTSGVNKAKFISGNEPSYYGQDGFYGVFSKKLVPYWPYLKGYSALGKIAVWGVIIEHEFGCRAQYARVISINKVRGGSLIENFSVKRKLNKIYCQKVFT